MTSLSSSPGSASGGTDSLMLQPEKVLQFGTGVLMKGLPDFLLQKANEAGKFTGRIVLVKSTSRPSSAGQSNLYHVFENGIREGKTHQQLHPVSCISREINAATNWAEVLAVAASPDLEVIVSNTTEAGIQYVEESLFSSPPASYPAKLTAVLYHRYKAGLPGVVVIPCELLPNNGKIVKEMVLRHAAAHSLPVSFEEWLTTQCRYCDSLVDRIVSGHPKPDELEKIETILGKKVPDLIEAEPYLLWAIECDDATRKRLNWDGVHPNWILAPDITMYRERKLRILNGTHTIMVALGILKGHTTVLDCMEDPYMSRFIKEVALEEIAPATPVDGPVATAFALDVLDRFRNPHIRHILLNITLQFTMKMAMRNLATLQRYEAKFGAPPLRMALGFAAYLKFMDPVELENGKWYGRRNGIRFEIQDDKAAVFVELRKSETYPEPVFSSEALWEGFQFSEGFQMAVLEAYQTL